MNVDALVLALANMPDEQARAFLNHVLGAATAIRAARSALIAEPGDDAADE